MKEIELTNYDLSRIKDLAHKEWINNSMKDDTFLCQCYMTAIKVYLNSRGIVLKDGKLYEQEK